MNLDTSMYRMQLLGNPEIAKFHRSNMGNLASILSDKNLATYLAWSPRHPNIFSKRLMACKIAQAVVYLHELSIEHGAICSQNVFMTQMWQVKLSGFSSSRIIESDIASDVFMFGQFLTS